MACHCMLQPTATTYRGKVFQDCSQATPRQRENGASPETYCLWRRELLGCTAALLASSVVFQRPAQAVIVEEEVTERVFDLAGSSVVTLTIGKRQGGEISQEATGSGIIWDKAGHIVTNYHCIQQPLNDRTGTQVILVSTEDTDAQGGWEARIVGTDSAHDLAVLRIDAPASALQPIKVGTSADLKVGQSVFAIGNPFGLSRTLTAGVVSGLNRGIPTPGGAIATGAIQTDAAINSGNSGGVLADSSGRLVGISTATFSSNKSMGRGSGVNFAISVDTIMRVVPNLIVYGNASGKQ